MDKSTYRSYLLRLWRDNTLAPWRASLQPPGQAESFAFADLESLFAFLRGQADESQEQRSPFAGLRANDTTEDTSN